MGEFNKCIEINSKQIGPGRQPYIIAEMACAHDGNFEKAKALIDLTARAGADATQLQIFHTASSMVPAHEAYNIVRGIEFSDTQWRELYDYGKHKGLDVFICTYDARSAQLAVDMRADGIKLNSADLSNPDVLQIVAASGIPFTLGTGASTLEEISRALRIIREHGGRDVVLMHGVQNFPTRTEDLNISRLGLLRDVFNMPVGYHDHTDGGEPFAQVVDLIAVGQGANVIEKHITIDRSEKGLDYQAALEEGPFTEFVQRIRRAWVAYGSREIQAFTESDLKYRRFQKKSVVARHNIAAGAVIGREDVLFMRNAVNGVLPIDFPMLEGRKAARAIAQFENIMPDDLERAE